MIKLLIIVVLSGFLSMCIRPVSALEVQRTATGYVFMVQTSTGKHCWGMPQNADLAYFPTTAMDIEQAAKQFNWPAPTGDQATACQALLADIWTVQPWRDAKTRPVYAVSSGSKTDMEIDRVAVGVKCGALVQAYSTTINKLSWRMVTGITGKQGAAVCEKAQ